MKHTLIAIISTFAVFLYCFYTDIYISSFGEEINSELTKLGTDTVQQKEITDKIESILDNKKNIITLIVNKDHFENICDYFIQMKTAVEFENSQDIDMYKNLFKSSVDNLLVQSKSII